MKKLVSILLALAMILAMSTTVFATENGPYTLTITGATGHVYDIYQIYTGDISQEGDKTVLSNVKYGQNHYPVDGNVGDPVPADELDSLTNEETAVDILDSAVKGTPYKNDVAPVNSDSFVEIKNIPAGYYMIVDVTDADELPDGQTKSPIMLQMLEDVTIASKHATISSEKKVDDKNDSTTDEDGVNWQDSADYDIGDDVPFQLSVTLPSTFNTYDDYTVTFHDQQAAGFGAPSITSVYILKADGTTKITIPVAATNVSGYTLTNSCTNREKCEFGGCSFNITVGDINDLYGQNTFVKGDKVIVEYTSELLAGANIGSAGNENGMYVCHPDGHTPQDFVTVFTYELKVNKVDGTTKQALAGAGFTLSKWDAASNNWVKVGDEITGNALTTFTWSGIDGGKYKLEETTTPAGYNTIAPMEFTVDSDHKEEWIKGGNSAFLDLIAKDAAGSIVFADANAEGVEDGKLEGTMENYKGTVLPETGAEGTFFLITASTLLVMVAAVFMITRKKMSIYED